MQHIKQRIAKTGDTIRRAHRTYLTTDGIISRPICTKRPSICLPRSAKIPPVFFLIFSNPSNLFGISYTFSSAVLRYKSVVANSISFSNFLGCLYLYAVLP